MQIAKCKLKIEKCGIGNLQFAICNFHFAMDVFSLSSVPSVLNESI